MRLVMLSAVVLGLTFVTRSKESPERQPTDLPDEPPDPVEVKPPDQSLWDEDEAPTPSSPLRGAREQVPRPKVTNVDPGPRPASTEDPLLEADEARVNPRVEPEAIKAAVEGVAPEIEECLHEWWMLQPELSGKVVMEFELGPQGLDDVFVLDHDGVPGGVLSCFGSAFEGTESQGDSG